MPNQDIAAALRRAGAVMRQRPEAALREDLPAVARWRGDLRVVTDHPLGKSWPTDMPPAMGGGGEDPTPGWLSRASLAACVATCIAMAAAVENIELAGLEVTASSRSDARGLLGIADSSGGLIDPAPQNTKVLVAIRGAGAPAGVVRELVVGAFERSPVVRALRDTVDLEISVEAM